MKRIGPLGTEGSVTPAVSGMELCHLHQAGWWEAILPAAQWQPNIGEFPEVLKGAKCLTLIGNHCFCWCTWHCKSYCWALNGCSTALQDVGGWRSLLAAFHPNCFILSICSVPLWWEISVCQKLPTKAPALFGRNRWVSVTLVLIKLMDSSCKNGQK